MKHVFTYLLILALGFSFSSSYSQDSDGDNLTQSDSTLYDMSLEELMNLVINTGNLTGLKSSKNPISITTINAAEIKLSPAKNIYDLIEIYVPGLSVTEHTMGPHPAIRGFSGIRNDKFLLLLNGKLMNDRVSAGAVAELNMWDLDDIEKIEVIRGPGSIIYGPGAIAGVISITTKRAGDSEGFNVRTGYVAPYNSKRASFDVGYKSEDNKVSALFYGSVAKTEGTNKALVYGVSGDKKGINQDFGYGYIGDETTVWNDEVLMPIHMADNFAGPQVKLFLDVNYARNWNTWIRYTEGGTSHVFGGVSRKKVYIGDDTLYYDRLATSHRQLTAVTKNETDINEMLKLSTTASVRLYEFNKRKFDKSITHRRYYGDTELMLNSILNFSPNEKIKVAAGLEYMHSKVGQGWEGRLEEMVWGGSEEIISDSNAVKYSSGKKHYFVGDGVTSSIFSVFGEANIQLHQYLDVQASARFDDHKWASPVFSPKVAAISEISSNKVIKAYWQRSARYLNSETMYVPYMDGNEMDPEILSTMELMYSSLIKDKVLAQASVFYNSTELIGMDKSNSGDPNLGIVGQMINLGVLKTYGAEFEAEYKTEKARIGLNHAMNMLASWELGPHTEQQYIQGISFATYDYNYQSVDSKGNPYLADSIIANKYHNTGIGNSLNNIPTHSTKLFAHYNVNQYLALHIDSRINWKYDGYLDGIEGTKRASEAFGIDASSVYNDLESRNAGGMDIRLNLGAAISPVENFDILLYAQNIPIQGSDSNKRYFYNTGEKYHYPVKNYMLDVMTLSAKLQYSF